MGPRPGPDLLQLRRVGPPRRARERGRRGVVRPRRRLPRREEVRARRARADGGWHALHQASGNGHPDLVRLFLDAGARADVRAENTMEPIHAALQMAKPKVAALLIPALDGVVDLRGYTVREQGILALAAALGTVWKSNLQPDFNVRVIERIAPNSFAVLRELDESNRSVQKSAESTSI